jgi:hypothetical protein
MSTEQIKRTAPYAAALARVLALVEKAPPPAASESRAVEVLFGLDPVEAAQTARWMAATKAEAKAWARAQ